MDGSIIQLSHLSLETSENAQKPEFLRGFQVHSYIAHLCRRQIWISIKIKPRSYNLHAKLVDAVYVKYHALSTYYI